MRCFFIIYLLFISSSFTLYAHTPKGFWHGKERQLRYKPQGENFVIVNGDKKFNRGLYGTNTAFRIETGDIPELGFFMPNMGGNMQFGLIRENQNIWINNAEYIKSTYRAGSRIYEIKDPLLDNGTIILTILAMADMEGMIMKIETIDLPQNIELICLFGGADNKRFYRNGDLGVDDPDAFALQPDACLDNNYQINDNQFALEYGQQTKTGPCKISGIFPEKSILKEGSPYFITTPLDLWHSYPVDKKPVLTSRTALIKENIYYIVLKKEDNDLINIDYSQLGNYFDKAESKRKEIAETIRINTPDPYFNTLGSSLSIAADGIWGEPDCWQHGAVGWRMPLNGWRAAYIGDVVGWHDRARKHFDGYAASQITNIEAIIPHPSQDQKLNLARAEKTWGTQMYSNGYICRNPNNPKQMHHYDMNLVYIDELLWHFNWTGDMDYVREMWPVLQRHLAWEKRNYDPDGDGLYDAYACIWASDALQYNSGGVTYSSAYNYRANKIAAEIAEKLGEDPAPYKNEAKKILNAINDKLWLSDKGWWAEYKELMGNKLTHPNAGIWTIYHSIDSEIHTPFQSYQATRYIDTEIPHIPVLARGLENKDYYTLATTNWLPYSWSVNNVAFAEVAHTSLAYWQAGRYDEAFKLFKSSVLDGMYLGSSPGNIGQVSFYDAARGECYRDFGDPVGIYGRVLIQGLFGIIPDAMNNKLVIRPGFPSEWEFASISTPDIDYNFKRDGKTDIYKINTKFKKQLNIRFLIKADYENIKSLTINGKEQKWVLESDNIAYPLLSFDYGESKEFEIKIEWSENLIYHPDFTEKGIKGEDLSLTSQNNILKIYDPQNILVNTKIKNKQVTGKINGTPGHRTLFLQLKQGAMKWWEPVHVEIKEPFDIHFDTESNALQFSLTNNSSLSTDIILHINKGSEKGFSQKIKLKAGETSEIINIPEESAKFGSNTLDIIKNNNAVYATNIVNWNLKNIEPIYETLNIDNYLNAPVTQIFKNEYLSPRSPYTTLQIPVQGIGEWCHPLLTAEIDDSGIRKLAKSNESDIPFDIPFRIPDRVNNIAFTTLWDNYPESITIPLTGKASHAYFMMAGSTNHMQSHIVNGIISIAYKDGSKAFLELIPPETWAPIEQDFYIDNFAFRSKQSRSFRIALKKGIFNRDIGKELNINPDEVYGRNIDGGAGIILDIPLDTQKELESLEIKTIANEVVIGLMGITLMR